MIATTTAGAEYINSPNSVGQLHNSMFDTQHDGALHDIQLDYYGKLLASASSDCSIGVWDLSPAWASAMPLSTSSAAPAAPQFIERLLGHEGPVWKVSWSHPKFGCLLASCSFDRKVLIWKHTHGNRWQIVHMSDEHTASVNSVEFAPWEFGLHLACVSSDGFISVLTYTPENMQWTRKTFSGHPNGVTCVSWCPPCCMTLHQGSTAASGSQAFNRRMVTGGMDHQVRVWCHVANTHEWVSQHLMDETHHTDIVTDVAWRPNSSPFCNVIASGSVDGRICFWQELDNAPWKIRQVIDLTGPISKISWTVTGSLLAVSHGAGQVSLFKEDVSGQWVPCESEQ